ncbi:hypothetical protein NE237_002862 [Protea cynaroides]|uniref:DCD domain-containing protein n=1 Tax=Protea cynaroides TaxID=273540 RepID=A0A9Q0QS18_9MAGN|nr:hypothetical protein NE237_002862 [Protea cynaroides]
MVRPSRKGKAPISKSKPKTKNAADTATTEVIASELVKTDAEASHTASGAKENREEIKGEEGKKEENVQVATGSAGNKSRKRSRRRTKMAAPTVTLIDTDNPENAHGNKASNKTESMGMIFMCNSKTKKECYQYKVLGLPASKKDIVAKVYTGMRLFLFDVDLKLMYGVYKAAAPGGYNIEPKAFNSAFPSQVRFTVLNDCLPLAEEKFRKVIKDNYYGKNKFNCELNSEQVRNLCKLFRVTSKSHQKSKRVGRESRRESDTFAERRRSRWPSQDGGRHSPVGRNLPYPDGPRLYERELFPSPERGRSRWRRSHDGVRHSPLGANSLYAEGSSMYEREAFLLPERDRSRWRNQDVARHSSLGRNSLYPEAPIMYERETFPPPALAPPLPLPAHHPYALERPLDMDYYRRDTHPELHGHRVYDLERRRQDNAEYRDAYSIYRQPPAYSDPLLAVAPPAAYHLVPPQLPPPLYRY